MITILSSQMKGFTTTKVTEVHEHTGWLPTNYHLIQECSACNYITAVYCINWLSVFVLSVLQTHSCRDSRSEGWSVLLWIRVCCHFVFSESHTGSHTWWVKHTSLQITLHSHHTIVVFFHMMYGLVYCRLCSGQTCVQYEWPEGETGLEAKGFSCCLLWEHEAQRGDTPPW